MMLLPSLFPCSFLSGMPLVYSPFHLTVNSGKIAPNKLMKAAMSEILCHYDHDNKLLSGRPTDQLIQLYEEWGRGQLGIIVCGNIAVHREALSGRGNMIIDYDITAAGSKYSISFPHRLTCVFIGDYTEDYRRVVKAAKADGALFIGQLTHAGRQTATNITLHPVGPSDLQLRDRCELSLYFGQF